MRLLTALLFAFALAAQGLLAQTARAAHAGASPVAGLCLADEEGKGHTPDRDCVVHCLLGSGTNGSVASMAEAHGMPSWRMATAPVARFVVELRHRLSLDQAPRGPPAVG